MLHVEILRGAGPLAALREDWRALAAACDVFVDYDWLRVWLASFASNDEIVMLTARQEDRLVGLLPLLARNERWRRIPVRTLSLCTNQHSAWSGGAVAGEGRGRIVAALADALSQMPDWDMLDLPGIRVADQSGIHLLLRMLDRHIGVPYRVEYEFMLLLDKRWETYYQSLSSNFRMNLRRTERKLSEQGSLLVEVFTGMDRIETGFAALLQVDRESWKGAAGELIAGDPSVSRYYHGLASAYGARGRSWITVVTAGGAAVAAVLAFEHNGEAYAVKASSRRSVESGTVSPGHYALIQVIREACRRGLGKFHFLSGADSWRRYGGVVEPVVSARCFARSRYGRTIGLIERALSTVGAAQGGWQSGGPPHVVRRNKSVATRHSIRERIAAA